jgi:serine/threonine protein kinase
VVDVISTYFGVNNDNSTNNTSGLEMPLIAHEHGNGNGNGNGNPYNSRPFHISAPAKLRTDFRISTRDITLHNMIGEGGYGVVWKGAYHKQAVAVKMMHSSSSGSSSGSSGCNNSDTISTGEIRDRINSGSLDDVLESGSNNNDNNDATMLNFLAEAQVLSTLRHFNIVNFYGVVFIAIPNSSSAMLIVTELAQCSLDSLKLQLSTAADEDNESTSLAATSTATAATAERDLVRVGQREMWWLVQQILDGMCYLHAGGIYHRDLKTQNVLVFPGTKQVTDIDTGSGMRWTLKLCDFGLAKVHNGGNDGSSGGAGSNVSSGGSDIESGSGSNSTLEHQFSASASTSIDIVTTATTSSHTMTATTTATTSTRNVGTPTYMSPELLSGERVDPAASDTYAMGVLVWCMLSGGKHPYEHLKERNMNRWGIMRAVVEGERPELQGAWPSALCGMMQACWAQQPEERPSFAQLSGGIECGARGVVE